MIPIWNLHIYIYIYIINYDRRALSSPKNKEQVFAWDDDHTSSEHWSSFLSLYNTGTFFFGGYKMLTMAAQEKERNTCAWSVKGKGNKWMDDEESLSCWNTYKNNH